MQPVCTNAYSYAKQAFRWSATAAFVIVAIPHMLYRELILIRPDPLPFVILGVHLLAAILVDILLKTHHPPWRRIVGYVAGVVFAIPSLDWWIHPYYSLGF